MTKIFIFIVMVIREYSFSIIFSVGNLKITEVGKTFTLVCKVKGQPVPRIWWTKVPMTDPKPTAMETC